MATDFTWDGFWTSRPLTNSAPNQLGPYIIYIMYSFFCTERIVTGVVSGAIDVTSLSGSDTFITAFYMRAALGFDSLVCCIHYVFHYFPHNYRSDIHDNSFAKRKCSLKKSNCV